MEPFDTIDELYGKESYNESDVAKLWTLTQSHPNTAELWDFFGDVIQLVHFSTGAEVPAAEPLACYQNAINCDSTYFKAHESIAFYHDLFNEWEDAERHFRLAIEHGSGDTALIGLARVLEQLGRHSDAQNALNNCIDQSSPDLEELRTEIADGLWTPDVE